MFRLLCICAALALSCSQLHKTQNRPLTSAIPLLHANADTGKLDLEIEQLSVTVSVTGNRATTTFDLIFHNPLNRVLEGELEFPLADGQSVCRYALELNDKLREGVVVEKMKARIAFENTVRRGVDPGLVEKTRGNNFRTRIYPIPASGTKRVVIGVEQLLDNNREGYVYQLPLYNRRTIQHFSLHAFVAGARPRTEGNELSGFHFVASGDKYAGSVEEKNWMPDQLFCFTLPITHDADPVVLTETKDGQTYFYVNAFAGRPQPSPFHPRTLGLLWDISASSEKRNRDKDSALLQQYLSQLPGTEVRLIPFNIKPYAVESFSAAQAASLIQRLNSFTPEGGTQLGALDLSAYEVDAFVLFSDGLSSFGKKEMVLPHKPLITVCSAGAADYAYLKYLAAETGGKFIDLSRADPSSAANEMLNGAVKTDISVTDGAAGDICSHFDPLTGIVSIAGILHSKTATLHLQAGSGTQTATDINVTSRNESCNGIQRTWGLMMIDHLDQQYEKNKEAITALGKRFSVVTRNTSLLVLDRVEDYVQYGITPPDELKKEYDVLVKEKLNLEKNNKDYAFEEALEAMQILRSGWEVRKKQSPRTDLVTLRPNVEYGYTVTDSSVVMNYSTANGLTAAAPPQLEMEKFTPPGIVSDVEMKQEAPQGSFRYLDLNNGEELDKAQGRRESGLSNTIEIDEWKPHATYLLTLEKTAEERRFEKYQALKKQYSQQPSFFIDVARFFFEKKQAGNALLILSNVAEMKLEDAELLRMVALQLMDMKENALAVETFREVLTMRAEEPHTYRDLALTCNENGNYNEAVQLLYKVATGTWDARFGNVKSIALNEMNAIISAHPGETSTASIDKRLIEAMPVDVRIVIGWTSDNSDIDLWVTDPNGEKCYYEHKETAIGGMLSDDVTQGYGPEEFRLKKAKAGNYIIEANLYGDTRQNLGGPITIRAELFTDFGKPTQKRSSINFRVETDKEVVRIGSLHFAKS